MQYIDIFLASSISDLHNERMELGNYIRALNDMYLGRGIYFRLHMCEDMSDALSQKRSQDNYNDEIRKCDYFYIMCWNKAGEYTLEEFDVALEQFRESGAPKIVTFFKQADEPAEDVRKFMERLDGELQHYYTKFDSIDTVKLRILLEMAQRPELQMQVNCQDSKLSLNGQELRDIHVDKLPFYANHEKIAELRERLEKLDSDLDDIRLKFVNDPQNADLYAKLCEICGEKNKAEDELHEIEMALMKQASHIVEMTSSGEALTPRAKKAIKLFEQGKPQEALAILNDEGRRRDAERALEKVAESKKELLGIVNECQLKIDGLKSQGVTSQSAEQIVVLYEEMEDYVRKGGLDMKCLIGYVDFLRNQCNYQRAINKCEQLYFYFKSCDVEEYTWGQFCNSLANVYYDTGHYEEAGKAYHEALEIVRRLAEKNPQAYEHDMAAICNNLGVFYKTINRYEEAENLHDKALEIYLGLAKKDPQAYEPDVAKSYNNLGNLYQRTNRYKEAEKAYQEALGIRRRLAEKNQKAYEPGVAHICNNLGILYQDTNRYKEAEKAYQEALKIRRRLAEENPQAYEPDVAETYHNLGNLYTDTNRYEEAEKAYQGALKIRRSLVEGDPQVCERNVARVCYNLGNLYKDTNRYDEAKKAYQEALEIYRRLAKGNPQVYERDLAGLCNNLGSLYSLYKDMNCYEEAEKVYQEALEIYRRLVKGNPQVYEPDLAMVLYNLGILYQELNKPDAAQEMLREAAVIAERYKETNSVCRQIFENIIYN